MSKNKIKVYKGGLEKNKGVYMEDFLDEFRDVGQENLFQGIQLDFDLHYKEREQKIVPVIQIAEESDAEPIVNIFKEIYKDTYPYREFYDLGEVLKMIRDPKYLFVTFKMNQSIAGFYNAQLDFVNKRGYTGRLVLKKKWHGRIDVLKAALVSMSALYFTFKDKISVWYGETRTAHTKSQFVTSACGLKPIAFFPNKDRFLHKIESDLNEAEKSKKEAEELEEEYKQKLASAREEAQKIITAAEKRANDRREEIIDDARKEAKRVKERTMEEIEQAKRHALSQLRDEVSDMSLQIATKFLDDSVDKKRHQAMVNDFIKQLDEDKLGEAK